MSIHKYLYTYILHLLIYYLIYITDYRLLYNNKIVNIRDKAVISFFTCNH
jgi:hypothetical protein